MPQQVKIAICAKGDMVNPFPECTSENTVAGELHGFIVNEAGMANGKDSYDLIIKLPDGKFVDLPLQWNIFDGIVGAANGAAIRFANQKAKKN